MNVTLTFDEPRSYATPPTDQVLTFRYRNWHGNTYEYVVQVESLEWAYTGPRGYALDLDSRWQWVINGRIITRDGDTRPEMAPTRRRTFLLADIQMLP